MADVVDFTKYRNRKLEEKEERIMDEMLFEAEDDEVMDVLDGMEIPDDKQLFIIGRESYDLIAKTMPEVDNMRSLEHPTSGAVGLVVSAEQLNAMVNILGGEQ